VKKPSVPTALNLLALQHCKLHDVQILNILFAAVPKRLCLDSTRLTQGQIPPESASADVGTAVKVYMASAMYLSMHMC
jgi:hypothetical protein